MKGSQRISQWHRICNMRTTLLQLQYLHSSITECLSLQSTTSTSTHQDRLLQLHSLSTQTHQLSSTNFKILLITKLQSLLSLYMPVDDVVWSKLDTFVKCLRYLEEEMGREVGKMWVGAGVGVDLGKCQGELKGIQGRVGKFLEENSGTIQEYNRGIQDIKGIEEAWHNYLNHIKSTINERIQPNYRPYLLKKLSKKTQELQLNIKKLQQFIKS